MLAVLLLLSFAIFIGKSHETEFKLSDSKVLLPRSSFTSINYTIKGSPSICHEWSSSTPEVVTVAPFGDTKCSHEAVITSVWQSNHRATATIFAKNIGTGHIVKCDVIVDIIQKIDIETRTLELYLHETPEALIARAYDEFGNTFSTLDGLPFEWFIHASGSNSDAQSVLRFITWTESEYSIPKLIGNLEQQGLQGFMQLVSGLKTGSARVTLSYRDDKIKSYVQSEDVRLVVMANAALTPPVVYLIPQTHISYKIFVHSQGSSQEVKLPSNQYILNVNNSEIAILDNIGSTVTAKKFGQTEIILIDKNIKENFRHPSSILYVVEPGFLSFHISPGENQWILQTGAHNIYMVTVKPYDLNSHPIYMSDNMRLETFVPDEYFETLFKSLNGTYLVVRAIKEGQTTLRSKFSFILLKNGEQLKLESPIEATQDVVIYPPINVNPPSVILPWYSEVNPVPGFPLHSVGGSGEYKWMVHDQDMLKGNERKSCSDCSVSVDSTGFVKPNKLGFSYVVAADQRNMNNRGFSSVSVDLIHSIQFISSRVEVEVGNQIDLPIMALNNKNVPISHCHWLPFKSSINENTKIQIIAVISSKHSNISDACALLRISGLNPGFAKISIALKISGEVLTSTVSVGAYYPTVFTDPSSGFSVLAVKSSKKFNIIGGPLPWILDPSSYYFNFIENDTTKQIVSKLSFTEADPSLKHKGLILHAQCSDAGEVDLAVTIGNRPSQKNKFPAESTASFKLRCAVPVRMNLIPRLHQSNCSLENITETDKHVIASNKKPIEIEIQFTDRDGHIFDKSESLHVSVVLKSLSDVNIKSIVHNVSPVIIYEPLLLSETKLFRPYFNITPLRLGTSIGQIQITAKSNSYRYDRGPKFNLESSLVIKISRSLIVVPEKLILYHHENVSGKLNVTHGSGHFAIYPWNADFLSVKFLSEPKDDKNSFFYEVLQTSLDRSQRSGYVSIVDVCFSGIDSEQDNTKIVEVQMVRPHKVQLHSISRLQLGSQINVLLQVLDDTGQNFPSHYLSMLNFEIHFTDNSNILSVQSVNPKDWILAPNELHRSHGFIFKVIGEKIGFTSMFVTLLEEVEISSNKLTFEVFPPLRLNPKESVLLEGAEIQLTTSGGPQNSHDNIHFSIIYNETIKSKQANVEFSKGPNGLIKALKFGEYAVKVQVEMSELDPANDNRPFVLSKDEGLVGVVQIKGLTVHSPTLTVLVGNSIPLWLAFTSTSIDLSHLPITGFSFTGLMKEDIFFKWNLNPPEGVVAKLEHVLKPAGITVESRHMHSGIRLISLNPGKQNVEVVVSGIPKSWLSNILLKGEPLTFKFTIVIISRLNVINPPIFSKSLLLPPSTKISLKTSLDNVAAISYSISKFLKESGISKTKSMIHSGNILETNNGLSTNEVEQFVLYVKSTQIIKLNSANEVTTNQTLAIFVTVKHPTYSMISPVTVSGSLFWHFKNARLKYKYSDISVLPLGGLYEFSISDFDELGNQFDVCPDSGTFSYRLHRSDNIAINLATDRSISKNTNPVPLRFEKNADIIESDSVVKLLQFQGLATGDNTLQLFYHDVISSVSRVTDIVSLPTGPVLNFKGFPLSWAVEGLRLRFEAPFDDGFWYTSDRDIMEVDKIFGDIILKKRGTSNLFYSLTNALSISSNNYPNKNVLISKELIVHSAEKVTLRLMSELQIASSDGRMKENIPISLNFQAHGIIAAVYIYSSGASYQEIENYFKIGKDIHNNQSRMSNTAVPIECGFDLHFTEGFTTNAQELYSLFSIDLISLETEVDRQIGVRQWGCHLKPISSHSISTESLKSIFLSLKSELEVRIRVRLRHSLVNSESISVPVVTGYILMLSNETKSHLVIRKIGEVCSAIRLAISPATKHLIDNDRKIKFSVSSSKPNLLEVLKPRSDSHDSGIWIYPVKSLAIDKEVHENVDIVVSFPFTKQKDVISITIDIDRSSLIRTTQQSHAKQEHVHARFSWTTPIVIVIFTIFLGVITVMAVNYLFRPNTPVGQEFLTPSRDSGRAYSNQGYPYSSGYSPIQTQHIWNFPTAKKESFIKDDSGQINTNKVNRTPTLLKNSVSPHYR